MGDGYQMLEEQPILEAVMARKPDYVFPVGHDIAVGPAEGRWLVQDKTLAVSHPKLLPDGKIDGTCTTVVVFGLGEDDHQIVVDPTTGESLPLTIVPSLNCPTCAWHQWIREGVVQ